MKSRAPGKFALLYIGGGILFWTKYCIVSIATKLRSKAPVMVEVGPILSGCPGISIAASPIIPQLSRTKLEIS